MSCWRWSGHDHETETQATAMEALETEILRGLGITDPYAATDEPVG
jgi:probable rRNA maturation factor